MTLGIHHITAISSDAQKTIDFYTNVLGLRLVKKTVNQDDVSTYHLFFGDNEGHPGMDLTFFVFTPSMPGKRGNGFVTTISFVVSEKSIKFWQDRFEKLNITHEMHTRLGDKRIVFYDNDNQQLELVGVPEGEIDRSFVWKTEEITTQQAIANFYSATLSVASRHSIEPLLTKVLGYTYRKRFENIHLYGLSSSNRASRIEVAEDPTGVLGVSGAGTVHHIAFRASGSEEQLALRQQMIDVGLFPTDVIDRFYFQSVYVRTPAGILFEVATDGPGFTADEKEEDLGKKLALPPFLEKDRAHIEKNLVSVS